MALGPQQLVQPRRRQPLLAAGPLRATRPAAPRPAAPPPPRPAAAARRASFRTGAACVQVLADRHPRDPQLARHRPLRPALHQHFVPNDMYLIHPEHPLQRTPDRRSGKPAVRSSGGLLSERRMDHFPSGAPTHAASPSRQPDDRRGGPRSTLPSCHRHVWRRSQSRSEAKTTCRPRPDTQSATSSEWLVGDFGTRLQMKGGRSPSR